MKLTQLDLREKTSQWLNENKEEIVRLVKREKETGVTTAETSKLRGNLFNQILKEMNIQGPIYADEEAKVVKFVTVAHAGTKQAAKECETLAGALRKKWDDKQAERIKTLVGVLKQSEAKVKELRHELTKHQDFRGNFPTPLAIEVLGKGFGETLHQKFIEYRDGPMKELMALGDKWDKISEHRQRGEQFASLLPALKKEDQLDSDVLEQLKADAAKFDKWMEVGNDAGFERSTAQVNKLDGYVKTLKDHKTKPCTPEYMKTAKSTLSSHEMTIKSLKSALKTAGMIQDGFPRKAGDLIKTKDVQQLQKQIKTNFEQMKSLLATYTKKFEEVSSLYEKVEKEMAKKK